MDKTRPLNHLQMKLDDNLQKMSESFENQVRHITMTATDRIREKMCQK